MTEEQPDAKEAGGKTFEDFLLAEYDTISAAHFKTTESISDFVKHYLAVASLPLSLAIVFLKPTEIGTAFKFLEDHSLVPLVGAILLALIGLSLTCYVINLRLDALLYARTLNGIRKHFQDLSSQPIEDLLATVVLPKSTSFPRYIERSHFLFVVVALALTGSAYLSVGLYVYYLAAKPPAAWPLFVAVPAYAVFHGVAYFLLASYRERAYMRSHIIGVDVDGVMNRHGDQFCAVLLERTGKSLKPEEIVKIPVHEIPGGTISRDDEQAVFNWPKYWTAMPVVEDTAAVIRDIRQILGYRVWLFTHRGWPQPESYPEAEAAAYRCAWNQVSLSARIGQWRPTRLLNGLLGRKRIGLALCASSPIRLITEQWLKAHGIQYDRLVIERGNTHTTDPLVLSRNRFRVAQRKNIRAFVEDNLDNAKKLARICEVVFLFDQPYNQADDGRLPSNIVRVKTWREIGAWLRRGV